MEAQKRPLFTVDDINRLCTDAIGAGRNGQMLSDYLRLMACCGSRRDETLRLRWSDVDWQRQQLLKTTCFEVYLRVLSAYGFAQIR